MRHRNGVKLTITGRVWHLVQVSDHYNYEYYCHPWPCQERGWKWQQSGPIFLKARSRRLDTSQRHSSPLGLKTHTVSTLLTDGDKAAGPTAMLPKLCRDCLTIKISKEITLAYWQLFQLFAPVSLVLHMCLEWIMLTRAGHISPFHKWFTLEPSSQPCPVMGIYRRMCHS